METFKIYFDDSLEHHGILGQKWGKKNGPPYPLDASDHSSSEKKAGWKKSLTVSGTKENSKNRTVKLTPEQKQKAIKIAKVGAATAGILLATYGAYKYAKTGKFVIAAAKGKKALAVLNREGKDFKNIGKNAAKEAYKGFKEGIPNGANAAGKKLGAVAAGGLVWMAGIKVTDLMTEGEFTDTILKAYNDHQKKENKVRTTYRNKNKDEDDN